MRSTGRVDAGDSIDWDDLRYSLQAARSTTLAGAARTLGFEHTTIGRRLTDLEQALGVPQFIRLPDGLELTPNGSRLLPMAQDMERAVRALRELAASDKGKVRLSVPSGFPALITQHLARLQHESPDVTLELISGSHPADLRGDEAELALRLEPIMDQGLVAQAVGEVGWSLYTADRYLGRRPAPDEPRHLAGHEASGKLSLVYSREMRRVAAVRAMAAQVTTVMRTPAVVISGIVERQ